MANLFVASFAALATTATLFAPAAHADERSYLNDIYSSQYEFYGSQTTWLTIGYSVCGLASRGWSQQSLTDWVVRNTGPGIYSDQAHYIVISAEVYLC